MALPWLFSAWPGQSTRFVFTVVEVVVGLFAVVEVVVGVVVDVLLVPPPPPEPPPVWAKVVTVDPARKAAAASATVNVCTFMRLSKSGMIPAG